MREYRIDVQLYGTAYIKAKNEEEALRILKECYGDRRTPTDVMMPDDLEDPEFPGTFLSAAMSGYGPDPHAKLEDITEDEDEEDEINVD